ncbi:hypothetical protein ACM41_12965 [Bradyrhizobium sp. CCBAU 21362]|nr:hypothetical protein [Bradyrhizobium sp. CCBAU 21362]
MDEVNAIVEPMTCVNDWKPAGASRQVVKCYVACDTRATGACMPMYIIGSNAVELDLETLGNASSVRMQIGLRDRQKLSR